MGVNGRAKGATAERKLAKLFAAWWGSEFFRTPGSGSFATRGFKVGADMAEMAGDLVTMDKTFPFCVESKKVEGWTLEQMLTSDKTLMHKWWEQTVKETPEGKIPLLVFTKNHAPLYAMMRLDDVHGTVKCRTYYMTMQVPGGTVAIFALDSLFKSPKESWLYDR